MHVMSKEAATGHRRSARIWALELEKARNQKLKHTITKTASSPPVPKKRKRSRNCKRKSLQDVALISAAPPFQFHHHLREGQNPKHDDASIKTDQPPNLWMPNKQTLDFVLDILQRRDTQGIFAHPVDPQEVVGYYNIIKEPMDFATMRFKLQEGMYTSFEQFERDVFLICSNAMKFNSSATVYYTEARAISELAQRVFHALRTEPEKVELEYSWTRRHPGRKLQDEAASSHKKLAKFDVAKDGVSLNDSNLKRTTQAYLASSCLNPYTNQSDIKVPSGLIDGRSLNAIETERRLTYMHQTSFLSEKESIVSAVYNAPKSLIPVPNAGIRYKESLMQFVKDLGPTAQMVAKKKLESCPIEAPNCLSCSPTSFGKTTHCLVAAPSALQRPAYLNGVNNSQMPQSFIFNTARSYKGKMVCANEGMNVCNAYEGEMTPIHNVLQEERALTTNGRHIDTALIGEKAANTGSNMNVCGSFKGKIIGNCENMDLLIATLLQISAIQNQHAHAASGSYFPRIGKEDLHTTKSSQFNEPQSWLLNEYSLPVQLHSQTTNASSMSQTVTSLRGFDSHYPNEEGPSTTAAAVLDHKYSAKSAEAVQPVEWIHPTPCSPQTICDLPIKQTKVNEQIPSAQNALMQQQYSHISSAHEMPLFDMISFPAGANPPGHQAKTSAQCYWHAQGTSLMDNQQPDLALQL